MTEHIQLTDDEARALSDLRRDLAPPDDLEGRVLMNLRQRGLLAPAGRGWARDWRVVASLGVCAGLAIGLWSGAALASRSGGASPRAGSTPRFMLLLYEDAGYQAATNPSDRVREYSEWAKSLSQAGQLVAADELGDHGEELGVAAATSLNIAQVGSQPRGYFVIAASDDATAARVASTCPHLRHGGRIVMLPIVP